MGRRSSRGAKSNGSSTSASTSSSVVGKLEMLRNFCPSFSESDLSSCLSQAGYNVELAAERLMTGQFQPTCNNPTTLPKTNIVPISTVKPAPPAAAPTPKSQRTPSSVSSLSSSSDTKKRPSPRDTSTTHSARPEKKRSPHVIPPTPSETTPLSTARATPANSTPAVATNSLLLCERWLVGTCTTRHGRVAHREVLELSHPQTGKQMAVRFRGARVEGTLCRSLSQMLTPLLRYQVTEEDGGGPNNNEQQQQHSRNRSNHYFDNLIDLRAEALMDDHDIAMGGEVPLKLTVYLRHPRAFFALFEEDQASKSSSSMFFANNKGNNSRFNNNNNRRGKMTLSETAFAFLQWAHYGNLPEIPDFSPKASENNSNEKEQSHEKDTRMSEDDSDDNAVMLPEEDFETENNDGSERPDWAKSVNKAESDESTSLPEMEDPTGFASVVLRPYQRQALHWMMKREQEGESREELEKELVLLSELAASQGGHTEEVNSASAASLGIVGRRPSQSISCDCGPVLVAESARKSATTLDGQANPVNHPLWQPRFLASRNMENAYLFYVNELLGVATCYPPAPPKQCSGGILADDMGLGKTVMLLALILKCKEKYELGAKNDRTTTKHGPTLVVAPLSLLAQWEEEIETKTSLTYKICYGDQAKDRGGHSNVDIVLTTYGTMQAEFQKQKKQSPNRSYGLLDKHWLRVILDEAHAIKNQTTLVSKACCAVVARYRWVVTGTVIHNSLDDVFALIKFLQHQPWCEPSFWKAAISSQMNRTEKEADSLDGPEEPTGMMVALGRVRRLLGPIMLRRTKDSLSADGQPILTLPPIESKVVHVKFTQAERDFYNALLERSQDVFDGFIKAGTASKSWLAIFSLLHRLRMACDHIALTVKSHINEEDWNVAVTGSNEGAITSPPKTETAFEKATVDDAFISGLLQKFKKSQAQSNDSSSYPEKVAHALHKTIKDNATQIAEECPICLETPRIDKACMTNCAHIFCKECLVGVLEESAAPADRTGVKRVLCPNGICPVCQSKVEASKIILFSKQEGGYTTSFLSGKKPATPVPRPSKDGAGSSTSNDTARQVLENAVKGAQSSKLAAVMRELSNIWEMDPGSKILVFSQFLGFLDLMETALSETGIPFGRLDGKMTLKQRVAALDLFKKDTTSCSGGEDPGTTNSRHGSVMLLSMKANGCGLDLSAASSVLIVDPWWNQSIEDQCTNRIHRIGQTAETVRVRRFIVEDSVEERMLELQSRKKGMANEVYSDINADGTMSGSRPTLDDFKLIFGNL